MGVRGEVEQSAKVWFEVFPWNDNLNTGIDLIDEQHQRLVVLLNELASEVVQGRGGESLEELFQQLLAYADYHFTTEEEIWAEALEGDLWFEEHRNTHDTFSREVQRLQANSNDCSTIDRSEALLKFLIGWLAYHIIDSDKRMAYVLESLHRGLPPEEAKRRANEMMGGATQQLIEAVLNMYEDIASRTMQLLRERAERAELERALMASEAREKGFSDAVMRAIPGMIGLYDDKGRLLRWNKRHEELTGYSDEQLKNKQLLDFFNPKHHQNIITLIASASGQEPIRMESNVLDCQGNEVPYLLTGTSLKEEEKDYFLLSGIDVSYLKQVERELRRALEQQQQAAASIEKANRSRDEFLASMSHELRTPLTAIIGNSEILQEECSSYAGEEQAELIRSIRISGYNQLALVNDILDMSKLESGKFTINYEPYDLRLLLEDLRYMVARKAEEGELKLIITLQYEENHQLMGDLQRITQILVNLLGNAIKFTEHGEVRLTVWRDQSLRFEVQDSGIGMSELVRQRLFQRFEQADESTSGRFGGSGLGLYISQNLAQMMGVEITVESEEGKGSCFTLSLPYQPTDLPAGRGWKKPRREPNVAELFYGRVLVAEDTPALQLLERRILEKAVVEVVVVANGKEAVERGIAEPFDLVLMDMQMPVMGGLEATKALRDHGTTLPIIALTANVMKHHREQFNQAGCDDFLPKPINKKDLFAVLRRYLDPREDRRRRGR